MVQSAMAEGPKDPREPLDPQVKLLVGMMGANRQSRVLEPGPMREGLAAMGALLSAGAPEVGDEDEIRIPGPAGEIRCLVHWPGPREGGPYPALVYLHGGGYVIMSPETHVKLTKELCMGTGSVVVSVDYRLAPEHPYPAPLDDCSAAFRWVRENAAALGVDPERVATAGDSAGGNAAAALTLRLLAAGEPPPRALALLCPWTDMGLDTDSLRALGPDDAVLDTAIMHFFRDAYVAPAQHDEPFASPLRADDVSGFPPTLVVVGTIDPLHDEGVAFARKLEAAGCPVTLLSHAGMPHIFMLFPGIDEGPKAVARICDFLSQKLAR